MLQQESAARGRLLAIFTAKRPDGAPRYSRDDVGAFVPLLALLSGAKLEALAPKAQEAVFDLLRRAHVRKNAGPQEISDALTAYFRGNPLNAELVSELVAFIQDEGSVGFDDANQLVAGRVANALSTSPRRHGPRQREVYVETLRSS